VDAILKYKNIMPEISKGVYVAPGAWIIGNVKIEEEASIWFNTVLRGDVNYIKVGKKTNIQDNCVVHVETDGCSTIIGDEVTIGHNAVIHACTIEDRCLIGMGATLLDGSFIGEGSIVGANTLISKGKKYPKRSLILGSPGKVIREVTDEEYEMILISASRYVALAGSYLAT
jgi:carbonic anhydrase/acetyltransferase-like protein (isoleucine patch superfamily)